jgi:mRNA interferase RelE/StbE
MAADPYQIEYAEEAVADLKSLRPFDQKKVIRGIEAHLQHEPTKTSRSRIKRMTQPFWSQYRLRIDEFRVYYDIADDARIVSILRVLEKGQRQTSKEADDEKN